MNNKLHNIHVYRLSFCNFFITGSVYTHGQITPQRNVTSHMVDKGDVNKHGDVNAEEGRGGERTNDEESRGEERKKDEERRGGERRGRMMRRGEEGRGDKEG